MREDPYYNHQAKNQNPHLDLLELDLENPHWNSLEQDLEFAQCLEMNYQTTMEEVNHHLWLFQKFPIKIN